MNQRIKQKLQQYAELAKSQMAHTKTSAGNASDNLSKVIRSKREADTFMAELNAITKAAKK